MSDDTTRYSLDRISNYEWVIFDKTKMGTPIVYMLYIVPLSGIYNYQLVLSSYDAIEAANTTWVTFGPELYSTFFYSVPEGIETLVNSVLYLLVNSEIDNPIELAHVFGGTVLSCNIRQAAHQDTH
jgi:hypothetical protein